MPARPLEIAQLKQLEQQIVGHVNSLPWPSARSTEALWAIVSVHEDLIRNIAFGHSRGSEQEPGIEPLQLLLLANELKYGLRRSLLIHRERSGRQGGALFRRRVESQQLGTGS